MTIIIRIMTKLRSKALGGLIMVMRMAECISRYVLWKISQNAISGKPNYAERSTCSRLVWTWSFSPCASPEFSISRSSEHRTHLLSLFALQHCTVWTPNLLMHSSSSPNSLISDLLLSFHITKSHLSSSKKLLHGCCITQMFGVRCAALVDYLQRRARSLVHTLVIRHETRPSSITPKPHQPPSILYDNHRLNSFILKQESWFILIFEIQQWIHRF